MLQNLLLKDFRCFEKVELLLHPETTILMGQNAQGKTSLIEAVCVLMRLQPPRTSIRTDLIRLGAKSCLVEGIYADRKVRFGQGFTSRRLSVQDAICGRSAEYMESTARIVWMDHADMNLARGGAEYRRRYLDFAAAQLFPEYLSTLKNYERALRSRNYLLKRDIVISWPEVDSYTRLLEEYGRVLKLYRANLVQLLEPYVIEAHHRLSGASEDAEINYIAGYEGDELGKTLRELRHEEERTRSTARGIHRDELDLRINNRGVSAFCSEGQQRTLCLALKLAQAKVLQEGRGEPPLLLLDDIFGELDKSRRSALLAYLPKNTQKIITTTFIDWAQDVELMGQFYEISDGSALAI